MRKNMNMDTVSDQKKPRAKRENAEKKQNHRNEKKVYRNSGSSIRDRKLRQKDSKKSIYNVVYIFLGLFVLAMGYFTYFIVFRSNDVINSTYNKRQSVLAERIIRGKILSADGETLAKTVVGEDGTETREYPYGELFAHVVGRFARGRAGLEDSENIRLLTSNINPIEQMYNDLIGEKSPGDNVVTTLNARLQQVAYNALKGYRGAVVAIEPKTGKILAMVSLPSYDPNKIEEQWETLLEDKEEKSPLLNRAAQGLYPPGSTFKILTTLAYMRQNPSYDSYVYKCNGAIEEDGMVIHDNRSRGHGEVDLTRSLVKSCNTSYSNIGRSLDPDQFFALAEEFSFNKYLPVTMASNKSSFTLQKANSNAKEAMQTAIGQGKTLITPLHNAMIVSTIANGGAMMKPYVVDHVENTDGGIVKTYSPQLYSKPMTSEEAEYIGEMMRKVVTEGTATKLKNMKAEAAGKTGSADHGNGRAHSWFVGYAPYDNPEIAVSVVVESVGTGSEYAVPIAREVFEAYFNSENK
jgi:peptidoglycan glycosyltransferase